MQRKWHVPLLSYLIIVKTIHDPPFTFDKKSDFALPVLCLATVLITSIYLHFHALSDTNLVYPIKTSDHA